MNPFKGKVRLADVLIHFQIKNMSIQLLKQYSLIIAIPILTLHFYLLFLYERVFLHYHEMVIKDQNNLLLGISIFFSISVLGTLIFVLILSVVTAYLFQKNIVKIFHLPIYSKQIFYSVEKKTLKILLVPYIMYLLTLWISLDLSFLMGFLYFLSTGLLGIITAKFINIFLFFIATNVTNKGHKWNLSFSHIFIFFQTLAIILLAQYITWITVDITNRYYFVYILAFIFIIGYFLVQRFWANRINFLFLLNPAPKKLNIRSKEFPLTNIFRFHLLTVIRYYRVFFDYMIISVLFIFVIRSINQMLLDEKFIITLILLESPILFGIQQYFSADRIRFPFKTIYENIVLVFISIIITTFLAMVFILAADLLITPNELFSYLALFFIIISVQLVVKLPFHPDNHSNLLFFTFYMVLSQILLLLIEKVQVNVLLTVSSLFLIISIFIGEKNEITRKI